MTVIGIIAGLLAGFWGGVLVERARWVIDSVDTVLDEDD